MKKLKFDKKCGHKLKVLIYTVNDVINFKIYLEWSSKSSGWQGEKNTKI